MITSLPTEAMFEAWKLVFEKYKDKLKPNRISGIELLSYLEAHYVLTEINDVNALNVVRDSVMMNDIYKEKLPANTSPSPKAFYLENSGNGKKFYYPENVDSTEIWGGNITRIFLGIDISTGFYTVEGSTMLHDELNAIRGLDEKDLHNFVIVAQYISALKKFDMLNKIIRQ